jgi:hypothetical protein
MHHKKLAIFASALGFVALCSIAFVPPEFPRVPELVGFCFILGTMYTQVTLAAAWMAFGPLPFLWRLPLSLASVASLILAFGVNLSLYDGPGWELIIVLGGCLLAQWLIAQVPLWGLGLAYGVRVLHPSQLQRQPDPRERQFGIRELLIFTTIIGVILGLGRALVANMPRTVGVDHAVGIFAFLSVAAILLSMPLLIAGLLPHYWRRAIAIGLLVIVAATIGELPLLNSTVGPAGGPDASHLALINAFTSAWVLVYIVVIRRAGYRLGIGSVRHDTAV